MMSRCFSRLAIFVFLTSLFVDTEAFFSLLSKASSPGDDFTHKTMSHRALLKVVAKYLEDNLRPGSTIQPGELVNLRPLTSSSLYTAYHGAGKISAVPLEDAINEIIDGNMNIDSFHASSPEMHVNAEKFRKANARLRSTRRTIIKQLKELETDFKTVRTLIGEYLHIVQDFYSNTNWVEMKGAVAYEDLGLPGVDILPYAKRRVYTCENCDDSVPGDCENNLIIGNETLTSGYRSHQRIKKPKGTNGQGKCSHGGRYDQTRNTIATGGINKESRDPHLSPHNALHKEAAMSAMIATENFFLAAGYGLRNKISGDAFLQLFNLRQTSSKSLSIAMDVTGSMSDDIAAAKTECYRLIDERVGTVNEPANYVLVPFSDPDYGPVYITTDPEEFKAAIGNLAVDGGGDCPELSMAGTILAIQNSLPGSDLYVFTDASAKDNEKAFEVIKLGLNRRIKITYFITGHCGGLRRSIDGQSAANTIPKPLEHSRWKRSLNAYKDIAEETGGVVVEVSKEELTKATEIINLNFEGAEVSILIVDVVGRSTVKFPLDSTVSKIEIAVSTTDESLSKISYDVTGPDGIVRNDTKELINTGRELVLIINSVDVGDWTLNLYDDSEWHIVVNATSSVDFLHAFYSEGDTGEMLPLYGSPAMDQNITVSLSVIGQEYVSNISQLILTAQNGAELQSVDLSPLSEGSYLGRTKIPRQDFGLQLRGLDNNLVEFYRTKSVDVKVQSVGVTLQSGVKYSLDPLGTPLQINFTVRNHGDETDNYTVMVEDDLFVREYLPRSVEIPAGSFVDGYIIVAAENGTESGTLSTGSLKVSSKSGGTSNEVKFYLVVMDYLVQFREIDKQDEILSVTESTTVTSEKTTAPSTTWLLFSSEKALAPSTTWLLFSSEKTPAVSTQESTSGSTPDLGTYGGSTELSLHDDRDEGVISGNTIYIAVGVLVAVMALMGVLIAVFAVKSRKSMEIIRAVLP